MFWSDFTSESPLASAHLTRYAKVFRPELVVRIPLTPLAVVTPLNDDSPLNDDKPLNDDSPLNDDKPLNDDSPLKDDSPFIDEVASSTCVPMPVSTSDALFVHAPAEMMHSPKARFAQTPHVVAFIVRSSPVGLNIDNSLSVPNYLNISEL